MNVVEQRLAALVALTQEIGLPGYTPEEVRFMGNTAEACRPEVVFDWGTNRGSSARVWFEATAHLPGPPQIHTIDLPDEVAAVTHEHAGDWTGRFIWNLRRVVQHRGDGATVTLDLFREAGLPERALFFVDGDHRVEAVSSELALLVENAPRATILLHDTNHPAFPELTGPREAIESLLRERGGYNMLELKSDAGMIRLWPKEAT